MAINKIIVLSFTDSNSVNFAYLHASYMREAETSLSQFLSVGYDSRCVFVRFSQKNIRALFMM